MLDYESWAGNPSQIFLSDDNDQNTPSLNTFGQSLSNTHNFVSVPPPTYPHNPFNHQNSQTHNQLPSLYNHHSFTPSYPPQSQQSMLLDGSSSRGYMVIPKSEEMSQSVGRIGLNLGHRTYFSAHDDEFVNRLYRRSRPGEPGVGNNIVRCQAEGCAADLSNAKHYHRRHKVCEFHSKASTVRAAGITQRFCQQCSRFHLLSEFDNGKRSCRKRLADHNRRRRKSQQSNQQDRLQKPQLENARNSSSENLQRSPPDSATHSSSSVTIAAISPSRLSFDCFQQGPYQEMASSSASSGSLFYSSG